MQKTERLYYTDCYLREFEAHVVKVEEASKGFKVYLDRSAFYPASGGQPADGGTLGGLTVVDVFDEGETVAHILEAKPEGATVRGEIDWPRRFDHMQQHTGQHILSATFEKTANTRTLSFHLGEQVSTIDLDSDGVGQRQIEEAEAFANRVVFKDRPVCISVRPAEEAGQLALRKATLREGDVRLVEVEGLDLSACGGTHVRRTGSVGLILVRRFERMKGGTRVEFVCGGRALRSARQDFLLLEEAARQFSAARDKVPTLVKNLREEQRVAIHAREKLMERIAEFRARELGQGASEKNGRKIIRQIFTSQEKLEAKMVAHAIAKQPFCVGLIGVEGDPATLYFAQSAGGQADMGGLLKRVVTQFGGKGGGTRDFAEGGGLGKDRIEEALKFAESLL